MPIECCGGLLVLFVIVSVLVSSIFPPNPDRGPRPAGLYVRSKGRGCALGFPAAIFGFFAFMFRADNYEELALGRKADVVAGGMFATAFLLIRLAHPPPRPRRWKYVTALGVVLVWAGVSGPLIYLHQLVAEIRFSPTHVVVFQVQRTFLALSDYKRDCGSFPPDDLGLKALCENPGVKGWRGPYLDPRDLVDGWGNAIRYGMRDGRFAVWSCGKDSVSETGDDILYAE